MKKQTATEKFQEQIMSAFAKYQSQMLSESIKRGLRAKKSGYYKPKNTS